MSLFFCLWHEGSGWLRLDLTPWSGANRAVQTLGPRVPKECCASVWKLKIPGTTSGFSDHKHRGSCDHQPFLGSETLQPDVRFVLRIAPFVSHPGELWDSAVRSCAQKHILEPSGLRYHSTPEGGQGQYPILQNWWKWSIERWGDLKSVSVQGLVLNLSHSGGEKSLKVVLVSFRCSFEIWEVLDALPACGCLGRNAVLKAMPRRP